MGLYEQDCPTSETPPAVPSGLRSDEVVSTGTKLVSDSSLILSPQGSPKTYHFLLRSPCGNNPHKMRIEVTDDISASISESERKKFLLQLQICAISACPRSVSFREKTEKLWFYTCDVHRCLDKRSADEHVPCFDPIMSRCSISGKYLLEIPDEKDPHWILRLSDRDETYRGKHPPTTHVTRSRDILEAPSKPIVFGQKEYDDACCWHANAIEFREPRKDLQTLLASLSAIKFAGDMSDTDSFAFTFETARTRLRNGVKPPECAEQPVSNSEMRSATQTALERLGRVDKLCQSSQAYTGAERMLSAWENLAKASDRASIAQCLEELNEAPKPPRSSRRYAQRDRWYGFNESVEQEVLLALKSSRDELGHIVDRLEDSTELASTGQDTVECREQHAHGADERGDHKHTELCQCKSLINAIDQARLIIPTLSMIYDTHQGILHHSRYHKGKPDPADFTILDEVADVLRKLPEDG